MQWFGTSWGAPICTEEAHVPTPVGKLCFSCQKDFMEKDIGVVLPFFGDNEVGDAVYHYKCFADSIFGGDEDVE